MSYCLCQFGNCDPHTHSYSGECPTHGHTTYDPPTLLPVDYTNHVRQAAQTLATARVDFAEAFIRAHAAYRGPVPLTDRKAHEMTVAATKDAVTIAETEYQIALWLMRQGGN